MCLSVPPEPLGLRKAIILRRGHRSRTPLERRDWDIREPRRRYTWLVTSHPRRGVTVRRYASNAEADQHDLEYWKQVPAADRVRLVWTLSVEQ